MNTRILRWARGRLQRAGFDVVRYPVATTLDGHLTHLIRAHRVDIVLDLGANEGQFGRRLRDECRYSGLMHSFEPHPASFRRLQRWVVVDPRWEAHRLAIGEAAGTAVLHGFEKSDWNSLLDLDAIGDLGFCPSGFFPVTRMHGSDALVTVDICAIRAPTP